MDGPPTGTNKRLRLRAGGRQGIRTNTIVNNLRIIIGSKYKNWMINLSSIKLPSPSTSSYYSTTITAQLPNNNFRLLTSISNYTIQTITMFAKAAVLSALFAGSALAAPTSSPRPTELERRADWQTGKCEAHIALNSKTHMSSPSK